MFPEWKTTAFQSSSCSANFPLAIAREGLQRSDSRTAWRSCSLPAASTTGSGLTLLLTVWPGATESTKLLPSSKWTGKIHSKTRDRGGRPAPPPPPHQTFLFPAVTAHGPVSPASVWPATSAPAVDVNVDKLLKSLFANPSHDYFIKKEAKEKLRGIALKDHNILWTSYHTDNKNSIVISTGNRYFNQGSYLSSLVPPAFRLSIFSIKSFLWEVDAGTRRFCWQLSTSVLYSNHLKFVNMHVQNS